MEDGHDDDGRLLKIPLISSVELGNSNQTQSNEFNNENNHHAIPCHPCRPKSSTLYQELGVDQQASSFARRIFERKGVSS